MTQGESLLRLRNLLNEASDGFWNDTDLYQYLDSSMNMAIQLYMAKIEVARFADKFARSVALEPLSTLYGTHTVTLGGQEYSLPSDYLLYDYVEYSTNNTRPLTLAPYVNFSEGMTVNKNAYMAFSASNPAFYIRGTKIGFLPVPTVASTNDGFDLYYYQAPTAITSGTSGSQIPLKLETHEGIVFIAFSMALSQNNQYNESEIYFKKGMELLDKLT